MLVLQARSLLWALDPLRHATEGEVVITVARPEDRDRLEAQVQMLEPLVRPQLLVVPEDDPRPLLALEQGGGRFEWIVARQPHLSCTPGGTGASGPGWGGVLTALAAPGARLRLLFSQPQLGPATALRSLLPGRGKDFPLVAEDVLRRVVQAEAQDLAPRELLPEALLSNLQKEGWQIHRQEWEESLELPLSERLLARWFAAEAPYRASLLREGLEPGEIQELQQWFRAHLGARLPQRLRHGVLEGRWRQEPGPKKSPGRSRGRRP